MSAFDVATTPSFSTADSIRTDATARAREAVGEYSTKVQNAWTEAKSFETYVRTDLVGADQKAEKKANASHQDMVAATKLFDAASDETKTLEQQLKALEEEKARRIQRAVEEARMEGKTQKEIDAIRSNIEAEYSDRIAHLKASISEAGTTAVLKSATLAENKNIYQHDRFENISTGNAVYSGFRAATDKWLDVGKMQRNLGFMQSYMDYTVNKFDRLG